MENTVFNYSLEDISDSIHHKEKYNDGKNVLYTFWGEWNEEEEEAFYVIDFDSKLGVVRLGNEIYISIGFVTGEIITLPAISEKVFALFSKLDVPCQAWGLVFPFIDSSILFKTLDSEVEALATVADEEEIIIGMTVKSASKLPIRTIVESTLNLLFSDLEEDEVV